MTGSYVVEDRTLEKFPIFEGMNIEQVRAAGRIMHIVRYSAGKTVWNEGDNGRDFFLLLEGSINITQKLTLFTSEDEVESHDKSLIILSAEARPVIGEIALCTHSPRSAAVVAETDIVTGWFDPDELHQLTEADPGFGCLLYRNIARILAERLITANRNVLKLTTAFSLALQRGA